MRIRRPIDTSQVENRGRGGMRGGRGVAVGGGGIGLVGLLVIVLLNVLGGGGGFDMGGSGFGNMPQLQQADEPAPELRCEQGAETSTKCFITGVVNDVQDVWAGLFDEAGRDYEETKLVFFEQGVTSACGNASAAMGPFYCPADRQVYIDVSFFETLRSQFGAGGDFAQAYVIAHEFGHHVQTLLGVEPQVRQLQRENPDAANELSVRMELQADCLAGVWAHGTYAEIEPGDLDEALTAASAIGDDRIQQRGQGYVDQESFTHGSAEQRRTWLQRGYDSGDPSDCDTFSGDI